MYHHHSVTQILYLDIKSKDIFHQRGLVGANELIYDSTGKGKPLYIPSQILQKIKYPEHVPLVYGHRNKEIELGYLDNFQYENRNKMLLGDIHVLPRWNEFVLRKFSEGINGFSTEFKSWDKNEKYFDRVMEIVLERVAIVENPASHRARAY